MTRIEEMIPWEQILAEHFQDPEFRAEWERLAPARAIANYLVAYRADHGLSLTALGRRLGISASAVARLEVAERVPSLDTFVRISERLGADIRVEITPPAKEREMQAGIPAAAPLTVCWITPGGAEMTFTLR